MTDHNAMADQNETPEDVATLYSWANLHGAKYRDFSASRAQTREKARLRVQQAIEDERRRSQQENEVVQAQAQNQEAQRATEAAFAAEAAARHAEMAAHAAAEQSAQLARQQAAQQQPWPTQVRPPMPQPVPPVMPPMPQAPPAQYYPMPAVPMQAAPPPPDYPAYAAPPQPTVYRQPAPMAPQYAPAPPPQAYAPPREEYYPQPRNPWAPLEMRDSVAARPAWLNERPDLAPSVMPAPADTIQGSRDRVTSRWFALKGVFNGAPAPVEPPPPQVPMPSHAPVLAVFSLAGGVGKTSIVATLGRALSARGERMLLVDTTPYGLLPFYFGARDQRPGHLRTFSPPGPASDAPIQMVTVDPETLGPDNQPQEPLAMEIHRHARGVGRILIDLATASGSITRRVLNMSPVVLVPVVPDMNSVVSVGSIDAFFKHNTKQGAKPLQVYYVLNQFDPSLPLHLDVREVLREQLGDRLLPFSLRRAPAVSEALAEGMTVVDYAPNSTVAEDFSALAGWVKSLAAPASTGFRGVRWSER